MPSISLRFHPSKQVGFPTVINDAYVGLVGVTKAHWRDHDSSGFGLPPRINHRTFFIAYVVVVPVPSFLINGFSTDPMTFKEVNWYRCTNSILSFLKALIAVGAV
jgi:hypothetical protein